VRALRQTVTPPASSFAFLHKKKDFMKNLPLVVA
jgi:hypothetical protein